MTKYFSIFLLLLISNFANNSYAASTNTQPLSTDAAIQQAEADALQKLQNQLPKEPPPQALLNPNTNNVVTAQLPPQSPANTQPTLQTPNVASNPTAPAQQQNPWLKPNPWAAQAQQNPWANQPLPPAPNTNPATIPPTNTLPPPPNIFATPSAATPANQPTMGQNNITTPSTSTKQP